jgi:hypothetical protein
VSRLVTVLPARFASDLVDLLPVRDEGLTQVIHTTSAELGVFGVVAGEEIRSGSAIGRRERLVIL